MEARLLIPDSLRWYGLDSALRGLQGLAEAELAEGVLPPLYESGVRYEREPRGEERWLPPSIVVAKGAADCEDLAAYRAGELRVTGEDPGASAQVVRSGPRTWHAVVHRSDGTYEDPSAALGMRTAGGLIAPVRFWLDPSARDYKARVELSGMGERETYRHRSPCPVCALQGAFDEAQTVGFLQSIPIVGPLLSTLSQALSPQAAAAPAAPRLPAAPSMPRPPAPSYPQLAPPVPADFDLESGIIDLARQLRNLANLQVRRKLARRSARGR